MTRAEFKAYRGADQWDRTVAALVAFDADDLAHWTLRRFGREDLGWDLAQVVRPHRLFRIGDVLPMIYWNGGGQRQPVTCVTGRGYLLKGYYVRYRTYCSCYRSVRCTHGDDGYPAGPVRIVEPPGELVGLAPTAPAVRRFVVETLHGGDAACPATALGRALSNLPRPA